MSPIQPTKYGPIFLTMSYSSESSFYLLYLIQIQYDLCLINGIEWINFLKMNLYWDEKMKGILIWIQCDLIKFISIHFISFIQKFVSLFDWFFILAFFWLSVKVIIVSFLYCIEDVNGHFTLRLGGFYCKCGWLLYQKSMST